ncbi:MAG: YbhB/YbcL family Raf kinase inhibitor-like protein [Beijerinckiaceae bacterium]
MMQVIPAGVGRLLRKLRPGLDALSIKDSKFAIVADMLIMTSPAFMHGTPIPVRFTQDGEKLSPPLVWTNIPANAHGWALLVEDADSPTPRPLVHALAYGATATTSLAEGALTSPRGAGFERGRNSFFQLNYLPPDPPPGHGMHRYAFQLFAIDAPLKFSKPPSRSQLLSAIRGHTLAKGHLIGTYERR